MQKERKNILRIVLLILIIINCITIFYFSNQVADESSKRSGRIVNFIAQIVPEIKNMKEPEKTIFMQETLTTIVRKTAHFSIYAMLGILSMNYMATYKEKSLYKNALIAIIFCIFYATTDEIHQYFIPGRSCELRDVCIDTVGSLTGIVITYAIYYYYKRRKNKWQETKEIKIERK